MSMEAVTFRRNSILTEALTVRWAISCTMSFSPTTRLCCRRRYSRSSTDERRDVSIRRPRPSIRKQLTDSKQAASPKKAAARTKKKELEV